MIKKKKDNLYFEKKKISPKPKQNKAETCILK